MYKKLTYLFFKIGAKTLNFPSIF
ncbi:MAG: hypothetical protein RL377_246, partial [Bacteroidota bacterium]